jgi:hypothetical protein
MPAPTRSVAVELAEHATEISVWRDGLPEKQRRRLIHPQSVVRRWRIATRSVSADTERPDDLKHDAMVAWRRFVSCVEALPPDQQHQLWHEVLAQAQAAIAAIDLPVLPVDLPTQCPHKSLENQIIPR